MKSLHGLTRSLIHNMVVGVSEGYTKTLEVNGAKQFGFCMQLDEDEKLTCCGDEPYNELEQKYAENSTWLLHEAFCLYGQADEFKPYEKHHSTVKDACEMAVDLNVENLILYHTEDKNIEHRQELYLEEGKAYYDGNLFVPDDLDVIEL